MLMSRTRQIITALSLIAFAFGLALVAPRLAFAHAQYASSIPAANEVVPNAPTTITITFTEALEPSATGVTLQAADGSEIAGVTSSVDPTDNHRLLTDLGAITSIHADATGELHVTSYDGQVRRIVVP